MQLAAPSPFQESFFVCVSRAHTPREKQKRETPLRMTTACPARKTYLATCSPSACYRGRCHSERSVPRSCFLRGAPGHAVEESLFDVSRGNIVRLDGKP